MTTVFTGRGALAAVGGARLRRSVLSTMSVGRHRHRLMPRESTYSATVLSSPRFLVACRRIGAN
jgi:hypothetical protein